MKRDIKIWQTILCLTAMTAASAACTPTKTVRGNILENYQIATVQIGVDTPGDVMRKLGSPTTVAPFDEKIWYYLGQHTEKKGILDPKVTDEKIVVVTFADDGTVAEIKNVDPMRTDIPVVRDKTPTGGQEMNAVEQFVGNLGKFNKNSGNTNPADTGGGKRDR